MASNLYMTLFGVFLLYYYTDVWGIDPKHAAFMFLITKLIDAVSDPAVGLLADRTSTKWGRYRPYLIWTAIPYALLGYLLVLGPDLGQTGKIIYAYVTYSLVMLAYTFINVPYSALLAVLHVSSEERTKATQYRFVFASLGSILIGAAAKPLADALGAGDEIAGFRATMILFAILSIILFLFTFFATRERCTPPIRQRSSIKTDLAVLTKNVSWILIAVSGILIVTGLICRLASVAFFSKYNLHLGVEKILWWMDAASLILTVGFVGQLLGAYLTPSFLNYCDKKRLMITTNLVLAATLIVSFFLSDESYQLAMIFHAIMMFGFGVLITLLFAMYTDCSEYGEWISGKNSAGLTVSASMFSLKTGSAIGSAIPAMFLSVYGFTGPSEHVPEPIQPDTVLSGIAIMFSLVPAIFFLSAAGLMTFYKIDRALLRRIEQELTSRRFAADQNTGPEAHDRA